MTPATEVTVPAKAGLMERPATGSHEVAVSLVSVRLQLRLSVIAPVSETVWPDAPPIFALACSEAPVSDTVAFSDETERPAVSASGPGTSAASEKCPSVPALPDSVTGEPEVVLAVEEMPTLRPENVSVVVSDDELAMPGKTASGEPANDRVP